MEKQPQADSSLKSPASKSSVPSEKEDQDGKPQDANTRTDTKPAPYHDSSAGSKGGDGVPITSITDLDPKTVNNSTAGESLPHSIISVDIRKSMPCDTKATVPHDADVSPEVIASVVTHAVVHEAALTVSESPANGSVPASDSSRVDALVEQEISKISDSKTDAKSVVTSGGSDSKPIPNGDIDKSPDGEAGSRDESVKAKAKGLKAEKLDSKPDSEPKEKVEQIEIGSCNGVPGIIRVESITKKEAIADSKDKDELESSDIECRDGKGPSELVSEVSDSADKETGDNLVDSSKTWNGNLTDSAKIQSLIDSKEQIPDEKVSGDTLSEKNADDKTKESEDSKDGFKPPSAAKEKEIDPLGGDGDASSKDGKISDKSKEESIATATRQESDEKKDLSGKSQDGKTSDSVKEDATTNGDKSSDVKQAADSIEKLEQPIKNSFGLSVCDMSDMTAMMTSQILTPEDLGFEVSRDDEERKDKTDDVSGVSGDSSSISASKKNGATCDVGVGVDGRKIARVAGPDGGAEEVDGQQASAEVEVTEDASAQDNTLITNGSPSPVCDSPTSTKSSAASSKPASATDVKDHEDTKQEDKKPESAASRKSIPDPMVYEPPERRRSAASIISESRKDPDADKSQLDEKQSEKEGATEEDDAKETDNDKDEVVCDNKLQEETEPSKAPSPEVAAAATEDQEEAASAEKEIAVEKESSLEKEDETKEETKDVTPEKAEGEGQAPSPDPAKLEHPSESEKGEKDAGEKEDTEEKTKEPEAEEVEVEGSGEEKKDDAIAEETNDKNAESKGEEAVAEEAVEEKPAEKESEPEASQDEKGETKAKSPEPASEAKTAEEASEEQADLESDKKEEASVEKEGEDVEEKGDSKSPEPALDVANGDKEVEESENQEEEPSKDEESAVKTETGTEAADTTETGEEKAQKTSLEEPKTLIEESKEEALGKETIKEHEEKEEDDTEKEITPEVGGEANVEDKGGDRKEAEIDRDKEEDKKEEIEVEQEEAGEPPAETKEEEIKPSEDEAATENAEESKDGDDKAVEPEAKAEEQEENKDEEQTEDKEKKDNEDEEEAEEKPKSPTKRTVSPSKSGRRGSLPQLRLVPKSSSSWGKGFPPVGRESPFEGISPAASPPKALKTPSSPQKPQKITSPKKKNGILSPIKTPKTPGADVRKLPPIKAPVGLAPNPNLKNIRSKIGSFDNIKYKPGGGDKKVVTKKLDWKATPKIGSLDHSFKRKHGKASRHKSEDGKGIDGESPGQSGDEAEVDDAASGLAETLIKPGGSTDMLAAITAES